MKVYLTVDLVFTYSSLSDEKLAGRLAVVVDVLRASTSICYALNNGAKEIFPVGSVDEALTAYRHYPPNSAMLCGEREGKIIAGFNLGNSPLEYQEALVKDKTLIFCSTNGSQALIKSAKAKKLIICGFVNLSKCSGFISQTDEDLMIICSGTNKQFSLDDAVCAGMLIDSLKLNRMKLSDGAQAGLILYQQYKNSIYDLVKNCAHGKYLASLGFMADLAICAEVDSLKILPLWDGGRIVKYQKDE
jgi:2-phosphosulfolactate phosphatase